MMDDVIEIKKADPDSHFKLLLCKCGSDNVAYVHYNGRGGGRTNKPVQFLLGI